MKKIIVLGASRYYTKNIIAAKNSGYYVIALDRNADSDGFKHADKWELCDIIDKDKVLKVAQKHKVDGIIPINDYGVPTAAYVSKSLGLPGISPEVAELATNKEAMRKRWMQKGVRCPKIAIASSKKEFNSAIDEIGLPVIFKPAHGIGGASRGVVVVYERKEIDGAIEFSQKFYEDKTTLVEEFIDAEYEHSAEVIIHEGRPHVIAISDKIKTPLPYRVDKNVLYPTAIKGKRLDELKANIEKSVIALDLKIGVAHVEIATVKDGFVLFELGARCGGGGTPEPIVPFCTGIQEFLEQVRILCGDQPAKLIPDRNMACSYHFIIPKPGRVKSISGMDKVLEMEGILDADLFIKPGSTVSHVTVGTERSGFIIAGAQTTADAYKIGLNADGKIKMAYY